MLRGEVIDVIRATLTNLEVTVAGERAGPVLGHPAGHPQAVDGVRTGGRRVRRRRSAPSWPAGPTRTTREFTPGCCERNLRTYGVAFCLDALGDIYLSGKLGLAAVTGPEIDRWLGSVAEVADDSFNVILDLGFAESIRREWVWRRSRGESTANLAAFRHLDPAPADVHGVGGRAQSARATEDERGRRD